MRHSVNALLLLSAAVLGAVLAPATVHAQAWLPAKGEGTVSVLFTNVMTHEHYLPDQRYDFGRIDSNTLLFDVTYGLSDRTAVTIGLPLVMSRYTGDFPHRPVTLDDGAWHSTAQDFRFLIRHNVVRGSFMLTPFAGTDVPSHDYEFFAHAAPGRDLKEFNLGLSAGRLFPRLGLVVQGRYALALSEGVQDQPRRYSLASVEGAYFVTPTIRVIASTAARIGHTGIDLFPDSGRVLPFDVFQHHDQLSRESYLNVGGGTAFSISDAIDLYAAYTTTVWGRNTHAVNRGVSLGMSWSFRGDRALSLKSRDGREAGLVKCLCEKSGG